MPDLTPDAQRIVMNDRCPWPERVGATGRIASPPPDYGDIYPVHGLGKHEVIVLLDDDPLQPGRDDWWSCVTRRDAIDVMTDADHERWKAERPSYIYVASSWRNHMQPGVCAALKAAGIDHYDFKQPVPGETGFHWSEVMPSYRNERCDADEYLKALDHPIAVHGFSRDWEAMRRADTCVLVLPCGRSAHLELGWFVGQGKRTAILLDGPQITPELMYRMVDFVAPTMLDLLGWLGVKD